ncbi:MAG: TlpA family protein disulfide reductase [Deltaproteobacteria bacterium]|jgi:thiol-disulfide isomerase/thioredoxin|nr:TlpA family protein disulfide reductase [Deltaproteobacteria bacterium]
MSTIFIRLKYGISAALLVLAYVLICFPGCGRAADAAGAGAADDNVYQIITAPMLNNLIESQGQGKIVVVSFFASWCPPCREEIPQLARLRAGITDDELLMIGISLDHSLAALHRFARRSRINFPVFLAADDILARYAVASIPKMLVFTGQGELFKVIDGVMPEDALSAMLDYLVRNARE